VRPWPTALAEFSINQAAGEGAKAATAELKGGLTKLYDAFNSRPFGTPAEVHTAAEGLHKWADQFSKEKSANINLDEKSALRLLRSLCSLPEGYIPDFDTARQIASAVEIVYGEWSAKVGKQGDPKGAEIRKQLDQVAQQVDLGAYTGMDTRGQRKKLISQVIAATVGGPTGTEKQLQETLLKADPEKLRDAVLQPEFLASLQKIRNNDFAQTFKQMGAYDPTAFKKALAEVAAMLPGK
jgi:hypothetical protein